MTLSVRLNLVIVLILALLLVVGSVAIILTARKSIAQEIDSSVNLSLELLAAASATTDAANQRALQLALVERLATLDEIRHLEIALLGSDGLPIAPLMPDQPLAASSSAPRWFVRLVTPPSVEYRHRLSAGPGGGSEIAIRPNPADEIDEAWAESRTSLLLLLLFAALVIALVYVVIGRALRPVEQITKALGGIERGDYSARLPDFQLPEFGRISGGFNAMVSELARKDDETRRLSQRALSIQEGERRHLAQELHDELGQSVSAIKALAVSIRQAREADAAQTKESAGTIASICDHVYDSVRGMMRRLRPAVLDELGLVTAISRTVDEWNVHHGEVSCRFEVEGKLDDTDEELSINVYRIVQECLTNAARHAKATEVEVKLARKEQHAGEARLSLEVIDNGIGFNPKRTPYGLGLLGIRERVRSLDGEMSICAGRGEGACICVTMPLNRRAASDQRPDFEAIGG